MEHRTLTSTDEELFERFRASGDRLALNELFQRYASKVGGWCLRMLPPHLAEEAAQESFVAVVEHARTFRGDAPFAHWIMIVTLNTCRRAARKEKRSMPSGTAAPRPPHEPADASSAEGTAIQAEQLEALFACLKEMPEETRAALLLHHAGGLTRKEIARYLKRPEGTVASWLTGGVQKLCSMMRQRGHEVSEAGALSALPILPVPVFLESLKLSAADLASQTAPSVAAAGLPLSIKVGSGMAALLLATVLWAWKPWTPHAPATPAPPQETAGDGDQDAPKEVLDQSGEICVVPLFGHGGQSQNVRTSADGRVRICFKNRRGEFGIWDPRRPETLGYLPALSIADAALTADGKHVALLGKNAQQEAQYREWPGKALSKRVPLSSPGAEDGRLCFVLDDLHAAAVLKDAVTIIDFGTGKETCRLDLKLREGRYQEEAAEAPKKEGTEGTAETGLTKRVMLVEEPEAAPALAPSVQLAAVQGGQELAVLDNPTDAAPPPQIFDPRTGKRLRVCERSVPCRIAAGEPAEAVLLGSPKGECLLEVRFMGHGYAERACSAEAWLWDPRSGKELAHKRWAKDSNPLRRFAAEDGGAMVFDDGTALLSCHAGFLVWKPGAEPSFVTSSLKEIRFQAPAGTEGSVLLQGAGGVATYSRETGVLRESARHAEPVQVSLAVSWQGRYVASAGYDGRVVLWDLAAGEPVGRVTAGPAVQQGGGWVHLAFSRDAQSLFTAAGKDEIRTNRNWTEAMVVTDNRFWKERMSHQNALRVPYCRWQIHKWNLKSGGGERLFGPKPLEAMENHWWSFALNERYAALFTGAKLRRFDLQAGKELPNVDPGGLVDAEMHKNHVAFKTRMYLSPGRSELHAQGRNSLLFDLATGAKMPDIPQNIFEEAVLSSDGAWLLAVDSKSLRIASQPGNGADARGCIGPAFGLQIDPTSRYFACVGKDGLHFTDVLSVLRGATPAEKLRSIPEYAGQATDKTFSLSLLERTRGFYELSSTITGLTRFSHADYRLMPGRKAVLFGGSSGILLLDAEAGKEVARFFAFPDGAWAIVTPDGYYTGPQDMAGLLRVFQDGKDVTDPRWLQARRNPDEIRKRILPFVLNREEGGERRVFTMGSESARQEDF